MPTFRVTLTRRPEGVKRGRNKRHEVTAHGWPHAVRWLQESLSKTSQDSLDMLGAVKVEIIRESERR